MLKRKFSCKYLLIRLFFLTLIYTLAGCSTSQKINHDVLTECANKNFKLGVVKSAGSLPTLPILGANNIDSKQKALSLIPIEEICSTLNSSFSINIDANVDRTPRTVKERVDDRGMPPSHPSKPGASFNLKLQASTENVYYGNLEYDNASTIWLMLGGDSKTVNDESVPDVVNVTYVMETVPLGFKLRFRYLINVKSSGKDVLTLKGIIDSISTPKKGLIIDVAGVWEEYVKHAPMINDAIKRDLAKQSNKS